MGIFSSKNWSKIRALFIENEPADDVQELRYPNDPKITQKKGLIYRLKRHYHYRIDFGIKNWKTAVAMAEHVLRPRRLELYMIYHNIIKDAIVFSQIKTAKNTIKLAPWEIRVRGKANEAKKELLDVAWFRNFVTFVFETELWGHSLIEFDNSTKKDGKFTKITLIPREHVRPETGEVVLSVHDERGINFRQKGISKYLLEMGEPDDLGVLLVASKEIILKNYSRTDWARRNEKFGSPFVAIRTASRDKKELDEKENMLASFGNNGYAILDDQDEIDFHEPNDTANGHLSFRHFVEDTDNYISILINGQTSTQDEKSYVGAAEVHERILNTFTKARMSDIQTLINERLIPFLISHGYPLKGAKFVYPELEDKEPDRQDSMQKEADQKKKLNLNFDLTDDYAHLNHSCSDCDIHQLSFSRIPQGDIDTYIYKVWHEDRPGVDQKLWNHTFETIYKGIEEGAGMDLRKLNIHDKNYKLYASLRKNALDFTSAKMDVFHQELLKMKGNATSYKAFAKAANTRANLHLKTWLETEQRTAEAQTQMALRWQDIQAAKHVLPYLKYVTAGDEVVRHEHALLDGTTLPVDDPFWQTWYPPNGYNCRCDVMQVAQGRQEPKGLPKKAPASFLGNPGMSMKAFDDSHPYFAKAENYGKVQREMTEELELWDVIVDDADTGKQFTRHVQIFVDEQKTNTKFGHTLTRYFDDVVMPPFSYVEGRKTVDYIVDGKKAELKESATINGIKMHIKKASAQGAQIVFIELLESFTRHELITTAYAQLLNRNRNVSEVWFFLPNGDLVKVNRNSLP